MSPAAMSELIGSIGRQPRQRTTLYADPPLDRVAASFGAAPLADAPMMVIFVASDKGPFPEAAFGWGLKPWPQS